jgi:hypothetical protein
MPSVQHESPIEIIRRHARLSAELVRRATPIRLPGDDQVNVTIVSADASNVIPAQFTADMVTLIADKVTGHPLLLVVIEPQGRGEKDKRFSWPAYLANLREAHQCDSAVLIVICWDESEARACRTAIPLGHPGFTLVPIVISPGSAPSTDGASPWLVILCAAIRAISMEADDARRAALDAIRATEADGTTDIDRKKLTTLILAIASEEARLELEALMETTEYKSDFFDRVEAIGEARGEARGQARGEARSLIIVLEARGLDLTSQQHDLVTTCTDTDQLELWLNRAVAATSTDDVFKD